MIKKTQSTLLIALLAFSMSAHSSTKIVSDIYPIQQIANAISGNVTDVIVDSPLSPHNYQIKPSDIQLIEKADLLVRVSEQFVPNVSRHIENDDKRLLDLINLADLNKLKSTHNHSHSNNHKHHEQENLSVDKHIWLSPDNARIIASAITDRLIMLNPEKEQQYNGNLVTFCEKVDLQKELISKELQPIKDKPYIVFHDAYQYFETTFNINKTAMVRQDVSKAIKAKSFVLLEKALKKYNHVCIFKEPQFQSIIVEQLATNENVSVASLDPIGYNSENTGYLKILENISSSMKSCLNKKD